jgi:hypothetical protein
MAWLHALAVRSMHVRAVKVLDALQSITPAVISMQMLFWQWLQTSE